MRRVWVVGNSGSGKSTLARTLAERLGTGWVELDSIFHQPGWEPLELTAFRARVSEVVAADAWVVDGNYSAVADLVRARADTIVWLDLPRSDVTRQVVARTVTRLVRREELWNGNRESWFSLLRRDPEKSIVRWSWTQHDRIQERYTAMMAETGPSGPTFIQLQSREAASQLLAGVAPMSRRHDDGP